MKHMSSLLQHSGGWSDEDDVPAPSISSPSSGTHVSRIVCMGILQKPRRFSFSARAEYMCSLCGDVFQYTREKRGKAILQLRGDKVCKSVSLSKLHCVHFQYDHTVEEDSMRRNRITFQYSSGVKLSSLRGTVRKKKKENFAQHTDAGDLGSAHGGPVEKDGLQVKSKNSFRKQFTELTFSAPTDKDMFRWEASLRAVPCLDKKCRSMLKDHLGRMRPFHRGMGQKGRVASSMRLTGSVGSMQTSNSDSGSDPAEHKEVAAINMFETVRSLCVQLPDDLGIMNIALDSSSLETTVSDVKAKVFEFIREMERGLHAQSGLATGADLPRRGEIQNVNEIASQSGLSDARDANDSPITIELAKQQFINPLLQDAEQHSKKMSPSAFESPRSGSRLVDSNHLPNQVLNPFSEMEQQLVETTAKTADGSAGENISPSVKDEAGSLINSKQALARYELENVKEVLRRGEKSFLLYRPFRQMDADRGKELWAFDEHKSIESLSTNGTGRLHLELRAASDMPQSGLKCIVQKIKAKDIFGKVTDHYQMRIMAADLSWVVKYKFAAIKKFASSLNNGYLKLPLEQRLHLASQYYSHGRMPGKISSQGKNPLPLPTLSKLADNVESVQTYLNMILGHPWASSGHHLLEFLGAATASRERTDRMVVHVSQLKNYVSPGDIVLFKCSDRWSGITRLVLNDRFDHIGVVVPGKKLDSSLRILESTGEGVKTYPLVGRLRGYFLADFVHSISIRRIIAPRSKDKLASCAKFLANVEGKPYRLRQAVAGRLKGRHTKHSGAGKSASELNSQKRRKSMDGSQSGYFCSELVAAYLKHLGFIGDGDADCAAYWPGDFDEGGLVEQDVQRMGFKVERIVDLDLRIVELAKAKRREFINDAPARKDQNSSTSAI